MLFIWPHVRFISVTEGTRVSYVPLIFCVESRQEFQSTREAKRRFVAAYALMLDFYGVKLVDKNGNVARDRKSVV